MAEDFASFSTPGTSSSDELAAGFETVADEVLTIAQVAQAFGTTSRALRFYEDKGLLSPPPKGCGPALWPGGTAAAGAGAQGQDARICARRNATHAGAPGGPAALNVSRRQCHDQIKHLEQRRREIELALAELRRTYSSFYARIAGGGE
jgi:DNA-binding transcriptional MerR regulator